MQVVFKKLGYIIFGSRRGVAQFGSALAWGARGRGFKSRRSDQIRGLITLESECAHFVIEYLYKI